jgi:hypothetical protein
VTKQASREIRKLREEVRYLRRFVARLTQAVYTHTRTDIAPDAALPAMRRMRDEIRRGRR